jgi:16S rRNA C1402 (ribose-2'-O) methylase RsmI
MRQFFETLAKVLRESDRKVFVGVDISGEHEDFWFDTADRIFKRVIELPEKRNYVVIVQGNGGDMPVKKPLPGKHPQKHNRPKTNRSGNRPKKGPPVRRR